MPGGPLWTADEDAKIRSGYPMLGKRLKLPGRCRTSIRSRAASLGVRWIKLRDRPTKRCTKCRAVKAIDEFRERLKSRFPGGPKLYQCRNPVCRVCEAAISRARPADKKKAIRKRWHDRHPDAIKQIARRRAESGRLGRDNRKYYANHREEQIARSGAWARKNATRISARRRALYAVDPSGPKMCAHRRRARKKGNGGNLTKTEWKAIVVEFGGACAYCCRTDLKLTLDHVLPLAQGGCHDAANVVPACKPCNCKKQNRTPEQAGMKIHRPP